MVLLCGEAEMMKNIQPCSEADCDSDSDSDRWVNSGVDGELTAILTGELTAILTGELTVELMVS